MRIGMMADLYKPHVSGVTNYIALNKRYLESEGHEVYVFTFGDEDYQEDEPNVIRSPGLPISDTGMHFSLRYTREARRTLRTMDVAHVHHPFISGSIALRYCRVNRIPIIFTNHTRYDLYAKAYLPFLVDMIGVAALKAYLLSFCRSCDLVVSPSAGMKDVLKDMGIDVPIDVVPNGVDIKPFLDPVEPLERAEFGFQAQDVILVYMGRLGPEKNLSFLLRSFAGIAQAYDNVQLMLIGVGPTKADLQDQVKYMGIEGRVRFTGLVPYDQMPRYLAIGDAFVTASITEVHPLSVIEAMAAGLPVLGIDSPGIGDTIQDGVTGYLIPKEDLAAYTAQMVRLVVDQKQREQMSGEARKSVTSYAIENTTQMMLERYQRVIEDVSHRKRSLRYRLGHLFSGSQK
jgi:glycosyltransferase involved in cell wall biosynthesis